MSYRKHAVSKGARRAHHRREKARRRKLREKGGQVEPFGYADIRGRTKAQLRIMSITKGQRDGAPRLLANAEVPENGQIVTAIGQGSAGLAEASPIPSQDTER